MKESIDLLRNPKYFQKLCQKINKDYKCKQLYLCRGCPANIFRETQRLMDMKNLSLGDAYRSQERISFTDEERREILKDILKRGEE